MLNTKIYRFTAIWCAPCKTFGPIADDVVAELGTDVEYEVIDVDEHPELAKEYGIMSIPSVYVVDTEGRRKVPVVTTHAGFKRVLTAVL